MSHCFKNGPALEGTANLLDSYRKLRHDTLYNLDSETSRDDAMAALDAAKTIYDNVKRFIGQ